MTDPSKTLNAGLSLSIGGGSTMKQSLLARVAHLNHSMYENFNKKKEASQTIHSTGSKSMLPTQADSQHHALPLLPSQMSQELGSKSKNAIATSQVLAGTRHSFFKEIVNKGVLTGTGLFNRS